METIMIEQRIQNTDQYDILIVDDTLASLELLNRILEERGHLGAGGAHRNAYCPQTVKFFQGF
jgi:hypothetical protein